MNSKYLKINQEKLEILTEYLGENYQKKGENYYWKCPLCEAEGADNHGDNLCFNKTSGFLTCWRSREEHTPQLRQMFFSGFHSSYDFNNCFAETYFQKFEISEDKRKDLIKKFRYYRENMLEELIKNKGVLKYLECERGITAETVYNLFIGIRKTGEEIDFNCGYNWAFPTFKYSTEEDDAGKLLIGFEYRPANFSKSGLCRESGCGSGLAMINTYTPETEILIALEGYLDCYAFYQHLCSKKQDKFYHIVTPSNGASSLIKQIDEVDFDKYKKFILFLDNDKTGRDTANAIKEKYPFFTDYYLTCGCKDFNEHYLNCIRKNNNEE